MQKKSLVSIVVPIYNTEQYLEQCIQSLLHQTYMDIEIILVDDGSTDNSSLICQSYEKKDHRIRHYRQKNMGRTQARQTGIDHSTGDYLMFVDSDDWIEPNTVEILLDKAHQYHANVVTCNFRNAEAGVNTISKMPIHEGYYDKKEIACHIIPNMFFAGENDVVGINPSLCNKLYEKKVIDLYYRDTPKNISYGEDAAFVYYIIPLLESIYIMKDELYNYRKNSDSLSVKYNPRQTEDTERLILFLIDNAKKLENQDYLQQIIYFQSFILAANWRNEAKKGWKGIFSRYNRLRSFVINTDFEKNKCLIDQSSLRFKRKIMSRIGSKRIGFVFMVLLILDNGRQKSD